MASFALRSTTFRLAFFTLEIYAVVNVATVFAFWRLNKKRSSLRYLIPVLAAGELVVATFIFWFSEVFGGFKDTPGDIAETLLALVWTQCGANPARGPGCPGSFRRLAPAS